MSIVAAPSATLLLLARVATIVVAAERSLVAAILLAVLALACRSAETAVLLALAAGLASVEAAVATLLEVRGVAAVASLLGLWGWEDGAGGRVGGGSGTVSLRERWAWAVGGLGVAEGLQVVGASLLALVGVVVALVLTLV